jgi:hypothetical protein
MPISFARMAALSESKPEFESLEERPLGDVRKGFTHFAEGDVLFAKITPCMEKLYALADPVEARFNKAQGQVEKLNPSLLAKAFRGQLVPQNPNDEPAEKLLNRIHADQHS